MKTTAPVAGDRINGSVHELSQTVRIREIVAHRDHEDCQGMEVMQ